MDHINPGDQRSGHGPVGPQEPMGPVAPVFMNLHVKCSIFPAKDGKDTESSLLHNNEWMNSQGIAEEAKCARLCLTLGGYTNLWCESVNPVGND